MSVRGHISSNKIKKYFDDANDVTGIHNIPIFRATTSSNSVEAYNMRDHHEDIQKCNSHYRIPVEPMITFLLLHMYLLYKNLFPLIIIP